jgi:hypothetical protein
MLKSRWQTSIILPLRGEDPVHTLDLIFGYFSPEVLLPITSIVATVAGILMMLGRGPYRFMIRVYERASRRVSRVPSSSRPHFRVRDESRAESPRE